MADYIVYERDESGPHMIAEITGENVTGPRGERIEALLRELGWPKKPADACLHGNIVWAARPEDEAKARDLGKS